MELYLIRHGQSEANLNGTIQGQADYELSNVGKRQAVLVGWTMKDIPIEAIYSSDLIRAFYTAESIAEHHGLPITKWENIREVALGPLEGLKRKEAYRKYPNLKGENLITSGIPGTETIESITNRCSAVYEHLLEKHMGQKVVLVSHGGFIRIFLTYLMAKEKWREIASPFVIGNTGITKVKLKENGKVMFSYVNQTSHLDNGEDKPLKETLS
ncbi:histidine phosphatase family protein [Evansella sp. AB-P1]|uniref:histidine phosphatase family protein n=1 Tax=Evansella sp. AB-P1 TaxID=3037653 RepID=UPI00241EBABE|nr:histidine phosphatase family protein [Evansella sp. AB-P1]MDG5786126.1 histidine phosphatase family protein [Evansella sp. AB-P1]